MGKRNTSGGLMAVGALLASGSLIACSDNSDNDTGAPGEENADVLYNEDASGYAIGEIPEISVNSEIQDMLPADIVESGTLTVGNSGNYPPMEFIDQESGEFVGFDVDLGAAIADLLGLEYDIENVPTFDQVINSLVTDRTDISITGMIDSAERQAQLDFIDYLETGTLVFTLDDSEISTVEDLCGSSIAMAKGTLYAGQVTEFSDERCEGNPIEILEVQGTPSARLQLVQGRSDAAIAAPEVFGLLNRQEPDTFRAIEPTIASAPMGIGVSKDHPELRDAVFAAVEELMELGVYEELVDKWGLDASAIDEPTMNAGT